jgi:hypothetical protein
MWLHRGATRFAGSEHILLLCEQIWVTQLLKERYERYPDGQGEMCPLMKARVLEWVNIF